MSTTIVAVSGWEIGFTVGGFVGVIAGIMALQVWSQRRRRRGDEATTSESQGAEAIIPDVH